MVNFHICLWYCLYIGLIIVGLRWKITAKLVNTNLSTRWFYSNKWVPTRLWVGQNVLQISHIILQTILYLSEGHHCAEYRMNEIINPMFIHVKSLKCTLWWKMKVRCDTFQMLTWKFTQLLDIHQSENNIIYGYAR